MFNIHTKHIFLNFFVLRSCILPHGTSFSSLDSALLLLWGAENCCLFNFFASSYFGFYRRGNWFDSDLL